MTPKNQELINSIPFIDKFTESEVDKLIRIADANAEEYWAKIIATSWQKGRYDNIEWVKEQINNSNEWVNYSFFGEVCDQCKYDLMPVIHHWIDQFYKDLMERLQNQDGSTRKDEQPINSLGETHPDTQTLRYKCGHEGNEFGEIDIPSLAIYDQWRKEVYYKTNEMCLSCFIKNKTPSTQPCTEGLRPMSERSRAVSVQDKTREARKSKKKDIFYLTLCKEHNYPLNENGFCLIGNDFPIEIKQIPEEEKK